MNARKTIIVALSSIGLALAAQASFADTVESLVTHQELKQIHAGESISQVTQALGQPENITHWLGGAHAMVYEISDPNDMQKFVYVNLNKDDTVKGVSIISRD